MVKYISNLFSIVTDPVSIPLLMVLYPTYFPVIFREYTIQKYPFKMCGMRGVETSWEVFNIHEEKKSNSALRHLSPSASR
jgi:hypothetical protein